MDRAWLNRWSFCFIYFVWATANITWLLINDKGLILLHQLYLPRGGCFVLIEIIGFLV